MSGAKKAAGEANSKLTTVKAQLEKRKEELEEKLSALSEKKVPTEQILDVGDQVQSLSMETLMIALQDSEVEEYNRIVQSLLKIEDGTYGQCIDCGQPISEKRLKSYPNASRCLLCQEMKEEHGM